MVAGLQCPPPPSSSPILCSPMASDRPRPHPTPPASSRASPWPPTRRPTTASRSSDWTSGVGEPQAGLTNVPGWGETGNRLRPEMLSAYDWLRAPWAGLGEGCSCPAHSMPVGLARGLCRGSGAWGPGAGSLPRPPPPEWRGAGSKRGLEDDRSLLPLEAAHSLRSRCPPIPAGGWLPARPVRTVQLGQTPILSKATIEKNLDLQGMWVTVCFT